MKAILSNKRSIAFILLSIIVAVMGVKIGIATYSYDAVVKGILGALNLSFLYLYFLSPRSSYARKHMGTMQFDFPKDLLELIPTLLISIVVFWSLESVVNAVRFMIDSFR